MCFSLLKYKPFFDGFFLLMFTIFASEHCILDVICVCIFAILFGVVPHFLCISKQQWSICRCCFFLQQLDNGSRWLSQIVEKKKEFAETLKLLLTNKLQPNKKTRECENFKSGKIKNSIRFCMALRSNFLPLTQSLRTDGQIHIQSHRRAYEVLPQPILLIPNTFVVNAIKFDIIQDDCLK